MVAPDPKVCSGKKSIQDTVWEFQQCSQFTDLVLAGWDGSVPVHKAMLAEVFQVLGTDAQDTECLIVPGVEVAVLEEALKDLYFKADSKKLLSVVFSSITTVKDEQVPEEATCEVKEESCSKDDEEEEQQASTHVNLDVCKEDNSVSKNIPKNSVYNPEHPKHIEKMKTLTCNHCGYLAPKPWRLKKHITWNHEKLKFECNYCDFKTGTLKDLLSHKNELHPHWKLERRRKPKLCDQCDFSSESKKSLEFHKRKEHGINYPCEECEKVFLTQEKFEVHKNYAHDKNIYNCEECSYSTKNKWSISKHYKLHHTDERFYCDQCDFVSRTKISLKNHIDVKHEGKRFFCEQCEYSALYSGGLKRHIKRVHEGVTYQCEFCEHKATTRSNLKLHIDAKHLGIKYPCDLCDYQASQPGCLKIHKKSRH